MAEEGKLLISDALPFRESDKDKKEELFLPRPLMPAAGRKTQFGAPKAGDDIKNKKALKKLKYIPVSGFSEYLKYLKGEIENFDPGEDALSEFGVFETRIMASVSGREETLPFHMAVFHFHPGCGLYLIIAFEQEEQAAFVKKLLTSMSLSGVGGKRTAGLGKFELDDEVYLDSPYTDAQEIIAEMLLDTQAMWQMAVSTGLPRPGELKEATESGWYGLLRRGGFVQSRFYSDTPQKRKAMYFMPAGSCFKKRFEGGIFDVSAGGRHPVYRYGKPLFVGVRL
jgi:CRISPR-associated protein Csm4